MSASAPPSAPAAAMTLVEALELVAKNPPARVAETLRIGLACGFTPMHLQTFLCAELRRRYAEHHVEIVTGLFEDLPGTLATLAGERFDAGVLVLEWADIDPRLGLRRLGGWSPRDVADAVERGAATLERCARLVAQAAANSPIAVSLPTLPLPPIFSTAGWQAGADEWRLRERLAAFAADVSGSPRVRVIAPQAIDAVSPAAERLDVKSTLMSGFPYRTPHAARLAALLAAAVQHRSPKKGLITDLDNTLWSGIAGDDGPENVSWDLEHNAQWHGLYQQVLRAFSEEGVLVGVASKNDPAVVEAAFARSDLLLGKEHVFPIAVGWGSKAQAVSQVLASWNVNADSVVFVDDSPLELAEVQAAHPAIECVRFPSNDPRAAYELLVRLRDTFGRSRVSEEDAIRLASLRTTGGARPALEETEGYSEAVLEQADAELTLDFTSDVRDARALELVNKTNQFNLNGRRFSERAWAEHLERPGAFLLTVSYRDRFGALGRIAALAGRVDGSHVQVDAWVMSCRAFARRIEHHCLQGVFERFKTRTVGFEYQHTPRNGPLTRLLVDMLGEAPGERPVLTADRFAAACPTLPHRVVVKDGRGDERYANAAG